MKEESQHQVEDDAREDRTSEQQYRELFQNRALQKPPKNQDEVDWPTEQPYAYELVPSITTYGIADAPDVD